MTPAAERYEARLPQMKEFTGGMTLEMPGSDCQSLNCPVSSIGNYPSRRQRMACHLRAGELAGCPLRDELIDKAVKLWVDGRVWGEGFGMNVPRIQTRKRLLDEDCGVSDESNSHGGTWEQIGTVLANAA